MTQLQEEVRDTWFSRSLDEFGRDIRYALRTLWSSPGVTATVALSLALGIGANTAVFSLIDAALLKMLPVRNPQELVMLQWAVPEGRGPLGSRWMDGSSWPDRGKRIGTSFSYTTFEQIRGLVTGDGRPRLAGPPATIHLRCWAFMISVAYPATWVRLIISD